MKNKNTVLILKPMFKKISIKKNCFYFFLIVVLDPFLPGSGSVKKIWIRNTAAAHFCPPTSFCPASFLLSRIYPSVPQNNFIFNAKMAKNGNKTGPLQRLLSSNAPPLVLFCIETVPNVGHWILKYN